ncbi:MAG TPA: PAS domain S-box protein [Aestuariivirga sp.]|jgi:two-component system sensor kinase FixL|nr:PAS domain S-box protein [Aestuariivirga sp.]
MLIEEQILQAVYDTSLDAIIVIDERGLMRSFNKVAEKLFNYAANEVLGKNIKLLMPPYFANQHDGYLERYLHTGEKRIIGIGRVVTGQKKDGSSFPLELAIGEARIAAQRFFVGFIRDLSERQQIEQRVHELQEELIHASRLASLGEISSMVAHEVNQPLSASGTYLEVARELLASERKDSLPGGLKAIEQAAAQIRRVGDTVRRIREFARKKTPDLALEDVNRIIEEANAIAAVGTKAKHIRTIFDLSSAHPQTKVDRIQIQQVIMNLVRNAIDAMTDYDRRELVLQSRINETGLIEVSVIDSGPGVTEAAAKRLFTPFMTTKKGGTGLGLAICRTIVEAHGGKLWYEKSPLGGAAFKFTLPVNSGSDVKPHAEI